MARKTRTAITVITVTLAAAALLTGCTPAKPAVTAPDDLVKFQTTELESRGYTDVTYVGNMGDSDNDYAGQNKFWVGVGSCRFNLYATDMSLFTLSVDKVDYGNLSISQMKKVEGLATCFSE